MSKKNNKNHSILYSLCLSLEQICKFTIRFVANSMENLEKKKKKRKERTKDVSENDI
jgi:transposase